MALAGAKRFYKTVEVRPAGSGWEIALDGRALKTPSRGPLILDDKPLADAISAEWSDQGEHLKPEQMPFYRIVSTALDRVGPRRDEVISVTLKFAETDLLCYRATEPPELAQRQAEYWQPILDWARSTLGCDMRVTNGVIPVNQPYAALAALEGVLKELDDLRLTAISGIAAATGSLVLALALARGWIDAAAAAELSQLDEVFQAERWGKDREAVQQRQNVRAEIMDGARFLNLLN